MLVKESRKDLQRVQANSEGSFLHKIVQTYKNSAKDQRVHLIYLCQKTKSLKNSFWSFEF